jgi:hypothetical protein
MSVAASVKWLTRRGRFQWLAASFLCLLSWGSTSASAADDVVMARVQVLYRNPDADQPVFKCPPSNEPGLETVCMHYPHAYTVEVKEAVIGGPLPPRIRAVIWLHQEPPQSADIALLGTRGPDWTVTARNGWYAWTRGVCLDLETAQAWKIVREFHALRRAGRISCRY